MESTDPAMLAGTQLRVHVANQYFQRYISVAERVESS